MVQLERDTALWFSAEYSTFFVADEASKYQLTVSGYSGDAGDAMTALSWDHTPTGKPFSTWDSDIK